MKVDLVLEGAGILGIAFIGALSALEEYNYTINRVAGSSSGALMATLISSGYSAAELRELLYTTDFNLFNQHTKLSKFYLLGRVISLIRNKGIYKNDAIKPWLNAILKKKNKLTFKDNDQLTIIASDITHQKTMVIPDCLPQYGLTKDEFLVSDAVTMSTAIPYYYVPYKLKVGNQTTTIVDGGLLSNFPIWIYDVKGTPKWPTFGIKIKDYKSNDLQNKNGFINYTRDIINTMINRNDMCLKDSDTVRTIIIDHDESIKTTDFTLSKQKIDYLYQCGYQSTIKFLKKFNFNRYCERYDKNTKK